MQEMISEIAVYLEREQEFRKKWTGALLYPALLMGVSIVVTLLLLLFVVPNIELLMGDRPLEGVTALVIGFSHLLREEYLLLMMSIGSLIFMIYYFRAYFMSERAFRFYLRLPYIKDLLVRSKLALFFRLLATLQKGGVQMVEALMLAKGTLACPLFEKMVEEIKEQLILGSSLAYEFKRYPFIPSMVSSILSLAEEAGSYTESFHKIADFYEKERAKLLDRLSVLLQPLILIFMALVVGAIMMGVLLPLTDMSSWALGE
jgi:general secretion pathway protein F/type IV pilus assembly protein PilC